MTAGMSDDDFCFGYDEDTWFIAVDTAYEHLDRIVRQLLEPAGAADAGAWQEWTATLTGDRLTRLASLAAAYEATWRVMAGFGGLLQDLSRAELVMVEALGRVAARTPVQEIGQMEVTSMLTEMRAAEDGVLGGHWAVYGDPVSRSDELVRELASVLVVVTASSVTGMAAATQVPATTAWIGLNM